MGEVAGGGDCHGLLANEVCMLEDPEAELTGGSSRRPSRLLANLEAFFDLLHDVWAHAPSPEQCGTLDLDTQQELAESKLRTLEEFQDHYMETERMY